MRSQRYLEWCNKTECKDLTNTQVKFVEFLFEHEEQLAVIGILDFLFIDVHSFIKNNPKQYDTTTGKIKVTE